MIAATEVDGEDAAFAELVSAMHAVPVDEVFALAGVASALSALPPLGTFTFTDDQKDALSLDATLGAEDVAWAEASLITGEFHAGMAVRFLENLAAAVNVPQLTSLLSLRDDDVEDLFRQGRLLGQEYLGRTAAPSWQVDTSSEDGLLRGTVDIFAADDETYYWSLGGALYLPQEKLRSRDPLSPVRWLENGYPADAVMQLLATGTLDDEAEHAEDG